MKITVVQPKYYSGENPDSAIADFLLKELGKNAKDMNDMQRSDYVVKMLAVPDSSFLKGEDFIIFVNSLQGKRSEE